MDRTRRFRVQVGDRALEVAVRETADGLQVVVGDRAYSAELSPPDAGGLRQLRLDDRRQDVMLVARPDGCIVAADGLALDVKVEDERAARLASFGGGKAKQAHAATIRAPMPGLVVRVPAETGQSVEVGQVVVVLQAMKMENELGSPSAGTVSRIHVKPGQPVEHGQVLVELE